MRMHSQTHVPRAQDLANKIASLNSAIDNVAAELKAKQVTTDVEPPPDKAVGSEKVMA